MATGYHSVWLYPLGGPTTTATNLLTDPAMKVGGWAGVTYAAGVATVNTAGGAYSPNVAAAVGTLITGVVVLQNPTAAPISGGTFSVAPTVGGAFAGGSPHGSTPVAVAPGQTVTVRNVVTLAGADNGVRLLLGACLGLVVKGALLVLGTYDGGYFDGDTPDTMTAVYSWTGAPNASTSTKVAAGGAVDLSCLVDEVAISHGRDDATSQPEASSCTLDLTPDPAGEFSLPASLEIGAVLQVTTTSGGTVYDRFVGGITDVTLGWDDAGEDTPEAAVGQVIATGAMDALARRVVGEEPWAQELDGSRVARIMSLAGVTLNPVTSDPGTVQILARDVDAQPALDLSRGVAESASGIVWQTRTGEVRYADAAHRRGVLSTLTLDACDVLVTPTWRRTLEGLVNSVSLGYGVAPEGGGDQPRVLASSDTSIARYGTFDFSLTTQLAQLADAQAMASLLMGRNSSPVWIMAALPVDVGGLDDARYRQLLALDMHGLMTLTGLPAIGSAPTTAALWVEGWRETLGPGLHDLELVVSGYCRTAPPPRWDDVNPGWTWDTMSASLTWDGLTCLGPPVNFGRWADVPASLRWDDTAPTTTWDTWV
jgi:hypothetical protein